MDEKKRGITKFTVAVLGCFLILGCATTTPEKDRQTGYNEFLKKSAEEAKALRAIKVAQAKGHVEPLIAALKDENPIVRARAAEALGKIKDPRAVDPLIAVLKDENSGIPQEAAGALGEIGTPAVEPLIAILKDKSLIQGVRGSAAEALGKTRDARAVEPLISALKDENPIVRGRAAEALGEIKDTRAVEPMAAALMDEDSGILQEAAKALEKIGRPAVESLVAALKDENLLVRGRAAEALGEIKDVRAVEPLAAALKDEEWFVRTRAAEALEKIKDPRAIAALKDRESGVGQSETQKPRPPEVKSAKGKPTDEFYRVEGDIKPFEADLGVKAYAKPSILVTLNGAVERRLTLDSGAGVVVIKQDVVRSLNLKRIGETDMRGAGEDIGIHTADVVLINTLEIGGMKITHVPATVMLNLPMDGVVGLPVIGRFGLVELDFKKGKLRFTPYDKASMGKDPAQEEPQSPFPETSGGHIIIDAWLNDNPCKAMVDTGAFATLISRSFLEQIGVGVRPPTDPRETLGRIYGFSGSSFNWWVIGGRARLRIGDHELPVVPYRNDRSLRGAALAFDPVPAGVDLILGMPHLKDLILTVDYLNNRMTLRPAD